MLNSWKIYYRVKPPSIEEFLTEEWIGPTARNIYPHIRKILCDFWKPDSTYRNLILSVALGIGKTFCAVICSLFCTVNLFCMRSPHKFFNIAESASFVNMLVSFTEDKAKQLLVQPFYRIMETSKKFHRVRQEEKLILKQEDDYPDKVCWTSAGKIGCMQFYNDIHYTIGSSPNKFLGLSLMSAIITEISFFMERGFSADYIWRTYQDCKGRVKSRFFGRYLSHTILDSSPNDIDASPIDDYIFGNGNAYLDKTNYIVTGTQWDYLGEIPLKYPLWQKTGETFSVFRGTTSEPPAMLGHFDQQVFPKETVYDVPIDLKENFIDDCLKSVKDFCGWPSGSVDKLIKDNRVIEKIFYPDLKNFYSFVYAPIERPSKDLLWNMVKDKFFIRHGEDNYEFYRSPNELRFGHIDQGEKKDHTGISFVHPELDLSGNIVYVTDFTMDISPGKSKINLDAVRVFIEDLRKKGRFNISLLSFDQYQSSVTIDYLKSIGINAIKQSIERDINVYRVYISMINSGLIKVGKNIILKNNLKSLQEVKTKSGKRKVDHQKGKLSNDDVGNWDQSKLGLYAKDLTDAHCGAVWNAIHNYVGVPKYRWVDPDRDIISGGTSAMRDRVEDRIYKKYGLRVIQKKNRKTGVS